MDSPSKENSDLVTNSVLYREFLAEREEILRHKWLESEKAGHDIGFERALLDWIVKHRSGWKEIRNRSGGKATNGISSNASANTSVPKPASKNGVLTAKT